LITAGAWYLVHCGVEGKEEDRDCSVRNKCKHIYWYNDTLYHYIWYVHI